jgi:hypothetical protein
MQVRQHFTNVLKGPHRLHRLEDICLDLVVQGCRGEAVVQGRSNAVWARGVKEEVDEGQREFTLIEIFAVALFRGVLVSLACGYQTDGEWGD